MTRLMIALSLATVLALATLTDAKSSSSSSSGTTNDGSFRGQIQSVATSNFTIGIRKGHGHGHRRRGGVKAIVVHYNPDTTTVTLDGTVVHVIDFRATGKYATVYGTIKNEVLEATSISVTTAAPAHKKKSKSAT